MVAPAGPPDTVLSITLADLISVLKWTGPPAEFSHMHCVASAVRQPRTRSPTQIS